ncbi:Maf family protein [Congregibacter brevis]|uniref:dTTP/UTP pyrophosphatase n=1 Tax=Congregibacter brevis TaxID=3081201 RepID=A0ABZ0IIK0_9GAMM|nr:Maf family protein [Congregibacter sp. IMCC45268]
MGTLSPTLVLGSASPRRAELLRQLGANFTIRSADIDETPIHDELPRDYVQRMAREKSEALESGNDTVLLTADTTVVLDNKSLGKPADFADAQTMLEALSGRSHEVYTAVCLRQETQCKAVLVRTLVEFGELSDRLIKDYLATDEPWDKAGSYAIQGKGGSFVRRIDGSVSNVIGLPMLETRELLMQFAIAPVLKEPGT